MINVGIDVGAKVVKAVICKNGAILAKSEILSGFEAKENANKLLKELLESCGISKEDVNSITTTGSGRKEITSADYSLTEVTADVIGACALFPGARTVIDIGAEEGRSIRCDEKRKVVDFAINEKCAAGAGSFTESMARALEIPIEDFGQISLKSTQAIPMNAQCAVFAESEVISLLHAKTPKQDIARAVNDAIASRISSMAKKVGYEKDIVLIGGVAHNIGFKKSLEEALDSEIIVPDDPEYVGAYGAALFGMNN